MGLRVTGDQSLPVRTLVRTGIFTHAKVAKGAKGMLFINPWVRGGRGVRFWVLPLPNKLNGLCDPWVQAVVNGTAQCGRFQQFSLGMLVGKRDLNFRF